jgi:hypothetical protein
VSSVSAPCFFLIYDSEDTLLARKRLLASKAATSETLFVDIPAGTQRGSFVARAILEGLGKQTGIDGEMRSAALDWANARAWAATLGIRRVVVLRAHLLTAALLDELVSFAVITGVELTLVCVPCDSTRQQRDALRKWGFARREFATLLDEAA